VVQVFRHFAVWCEFPDINVWKLEPTSGNLNQHLKTQTTPFWN
jgi:hypothetical protein